MPTRLFTHPDSRRHIMPDGHPERVARIEAVEAALADADFAELDRQDAPLADRADLARAHPDTYLDALQAGLPATGLAAIDGDTFLSPGSLDAARRAAGGACAAVDAVIGTGGSAFVATRPPGHHAERTRPMGFCLLGTAAIAAKRALDQHGLARVAVLDFDVHHGNGTQDILWDEPRARFASSHQMPLFPGTGAPGERGAHDNVLNVPLGAGTDGQAMRRAWGDTILPWIDAYRPELIVVSAGFDAHRGDPLAALGWATDDFGWLTREICALARSHAEGRVVSCLEGGYDLVALAASSAAHVRALMEAS